MSPLRFSWATRDRGAVSRIDSDSEMARQAIENAQNGLDDVGVRSRWEGGSNQATVVHINYLRLSRRIHASGLAKRGANEPQWARKARESCAKAQLKN